MPTFNQSCTQFIETPALLKPYQMDPQLADLKFNLEFEYAECSYSATLTIDVSSVRSSIKQFIFQIDSDDTATQHLSNITMYREAKHAPAYEYRCLKDAYQGITLANLVRVLVRTVITDYIIDRLFDNPTWFPYHESDASVQVEFGPERRKSIALIISGTVEHLTSFMPDYQTAFKIQQP
jgi:hypothetical protein